MTVIKMRTRYKILPATWCSDRGECSLVGKMTGDMTKMNMAQAIKICKKLRLDKLSIALEMTFCVSDRASWLFFVSGTVPWKESVNKKKLVWPKWSIDFSQNQFYTCQLHSGCFFIPVLSNDDSFTTNEAVTASWSEKEKFFPGTSPMVTSQSTHSKLPSEQW